MQFNIQDSNNAKNRITHFPLIPTEPFLPLAGEDADAGMGQLVDPVNPELTNWKTDCPLFGPEDRSGCASWLKKFIVATWGLHFARCRCRSSS